MNTTLDTLLTLLGSPYQENFFKNELPRLKKRFKETGILVLEDFIRPEIIAALKKESEALKPQAYKKESVYNVYVQPQDPEFPEASPRNRQLRSSKGCIPDDQVPGDSYLRVIYDSPLFRRFLCEILDLPALYPYADPLSSININYYDPSNSLEWHFDNADFAITLLVKKCEKGGTYEYFTDMRYDENEEENYELVEACLDGQVEPQRQSVEEGGLMIFRGNKSLHRVTPIEAGERILITLNFNTQPGISLSEQSRKTFFGRIG